MLGAFLFAAHSDHQRIHYAKMCPQHGEVSNDEIVEISGRGQLALVRPLDGVLTMTMLNTTRRSASRFCHSG